MIYTTCFPVLLYHFRESISYTVPPTCSFLHVFSIRYIAQVSYLIGRYVMVHECTPRGECRSADVFPPVRSIKLKINYGFN